MNKNRLEAFSDGVLAIIITIMVLEMKAPESTSISSLLPIIPIFLSYVLSFIYLAIYWINHHHLFQATQKVTTSVLWANMHLLFWVSLIPFTTSWMGENHLEAVPIAFYGGALLMSAIAFRILEITLMRSHSEKVSFVLSIRQGRKEILSIIVYVVGIPLAFVHIAIPLVCYVFVAVIWVIPNRKLEHSIAEKDLAE